MIPDEDLGVLEAARAIAAGRRVDWAAIESSTEISDSLAALLRELKVVEDIAEVHRTLHDASTSTLVRDETVSSIADPETIDVKSGSIAAWGPLRLLERVGEGAFGDVYRAWDPRLDREVALKLLKRIDARSGDRDSFVIDEGRLLARVRHPNVVTVYGADRIGGRVGLWMEFVRGRTLESILREHGPFGAQEAALIGLDVCRALSAVHRAGLVHRDVKAQNLMREGGGRIVLMDFGTGLEDFSDRPPEMAGTPLYLAPEVLNGHAATPKSDLYSVGVVLYHLVTQSYPVTGRSVTDIHTAHRQRRSTRLRDRRPDLADQFIQVVERALEIDPDDRFESAGAFEAALAKVVAASPVEAQTDRRPTVHRPRALFVVGVGAVAIVVTAIAASMALTGRWRDAWIPRLASVRSHDAPSEAASVTARRVALPPSYLLIGGPSGDGRSFSLSDIAGNLAVYDMATAKVTRLTGDAILEGNANQYAEFSAMSSDGRRVAYAWLALDGKYELRLIDAATKRPRVLLRSADVSYGVPMEWSHDNRAILWILSRPDRSNLLALVNADDGVVHPVKELGPSMPQHASISPDGQFVVYDLPADGLEAAPDVFIVGADGRGEHRLIEHPAADSNPVWSPDGDEVVFASDRAGTMDIWSIRVSRGFADGEPRVLHRSIGRMWLRGLTQTGSYFYYLTTGAADIYDAQVTPAGAKDVRTVPQHFVGTNISSIFSPDGRMLAYASRRGLTRRINGSTVLVIHDIETGQERQVAPPMIAFQVHSWSPDGRTIVLGGTDLRGRYGWFLFDVETARVEPIMAAAEETDMRRASWLPDGRLMYWNVPKRAVVARTIPTGGEEVILDLKKERIEPNAGFGRGYGLAPDGRTLAMSTDVRDASGVFRVIFVRDLASGASRELVRTPANETVVFQDWMPDGQSLLFARRALVAGEPNSLWRVSIHGGDPQPLGLAMLGLRDVSVRADGRRLTFTAGFPENELWVLEHFLTDKRGER